MAERALSDEDIRLLAKAVREGQSTSMFAENPVGGENDNSELIKALQKDSTDKQKALSKENEKLFNKLKNDLNVKDEIASLADVLKQREQSVGLTKIAAEVKRLSAQKFESQEELDETLKRLSDMAAAAGTDLEKLGIEGFKPLTNAAQKQTYIIKDALGVGEKINKQAQEKYAITQDTIQAMEDLNDRYDEAKNKLDKFTNVVKDITKDVFKLMEAEQRYAQATATADAGWISGIYDMGISQIEYMKILKDTRQESLAAKTVGIDFKESLSASAQSLHGLTATYEDAAKGAAFFHKNMARIGVSQDELGDAVAQQTTMYEKNYRALGYTVEEFANLTNELINDQGMRSTLLGLQQDERKAYILSVQQRQAEYLTMGYTIERAKELQKTFQALNKMNPKERMKQAAKTRAMLGALGMGGEGGRLYELQTKYRTMGPKEKAAAEKEMAEIQSNASKKFGKMSGSGASLGQSMVFQTMADKSGFTQIADTFETESGQGLKLDAKQLETTNEISNTAKNILGAMDYWGAAEGSSLGKIATNMLAVVGGMMLLKGKLGILSKIAGGGGGLLSKVMGKAGEVAPNAVKAASSAVSGVTGAASAAKAGIGAATKGVAKAAGKTALKAIPGIGLIVSLGLMGSRLADGDLMGAGMELVSGAAGLIPGIGTAASIGMSGAIVARDLSKGAQQPPEEITTVEQEQTAQAKSQKDVLVELSITMKALNEYLLAGTEASGDQVKAIDKQTTTLKENLRFNAVPDARAPS